MARNLSTQKINIDPDHKNPYNAGRMRVGKTRRDHANHAHQRARERKQLPIRCTSSHRTGASDNHRTVQFWGG